MNVAQLFVTLGIKGDDKAQKALKNVKGTLGEIKTDALLVKAALLGMFYGLEQLMSKSASSGNALAQFTTYTGKSAEELQRWQYAARQVGVSSDDVTTSAKNVQRIISDMRMGKPAPEGMTALIQTTGMKMDAAHLDDTFYVMSKIQEMYQKIPPAVANKFGESLGVTAGFGNAARRNAFNPSALAAAPILSNKEIGENQKVYVGFANIAAKVQMAMDKMTSKHGVQMVKDIDNITTSLLRLTEQLIILSEKMKLFEHLSEIVDGVSTIVKVMTAGFVAASGDKKEINKFKKGLDPKGEGDKELQDLHKATYGAQKRHIGLWEAITAQAKGEKIDLGGDHIAPKVDGGGAKVINQNVKVDQTLQFNHDGANHHKIKDAHKKSVRDAYRQIPAANQGS